MIIKQQIWWKKDVREFIWFSAKPHEFLNLINIGNTTAAPHDEDYSQISTWINLLSKKIYTFN